MEVFANAKDAAVIVAADMVFGGSRWYAEHEVLYRFTVAHAALRAWIMMCPDDCTFCAGSRRDPKCPNKSQRLHEVGDHTLDVFCSWQAIAQDLNLEQCG
eukprot:3992944-Karenia_brevis.AAC.1